MDLAAILRGQDEDKYHRFVGSAIPSTPSDGLCSEPQVSVFNANPSQPPMPLSGTAGGMEPQILVVVISKTGTFRQLKVTRRPRGLKEVRVEENASNIRDYTTVISHIFPDPPLLRPPHPPSHLNNHQHRTLDP